MAARVCEENVARNGVSDKVHVFAGTLEDATSEPFDVILANITIATLLRLHPALASHLRVGGTAVLSGVLAERAEELLAVLVEAGWRHVRTEQEQDWVAIFVTR